MTQRHQGHGPRRQPKQRIYVMAPNEALRRTLRGRSAATGPGPRSGRSSKASRSTASRRATGGTGRQKSARPLVRAVPTTRVRTLALLSVGLVAAVFAQMTRLQLVNPEAAIAQGLKQRIRFTRLAAERGDLVDRTGVPLAISVREWRVVADPKVLARQDRDAYAKAIATILGIDAAQVRPRLNGTSRYSVVARGLNEDAATRVRAYEPTLDGVYLEEEPRRLYPAGDLARGVLGRVNRATDVGETGLEKQYQDRLHGTEGELLVERGARGRQIAGTPQLEIPAVRGTTFALTLDRSLQYSVEGMLATSIAITGAKSGTVLVSQVQTGDVLVMANMKVDANRGVVNTEHNCALVCVYEPGSVNKAITIAAALEEGILSPSTRLSVPDRYWVSDHRFKDDEPHREVSWTPGEILANSSNIGTIKIAQKIGKDRLDQYLRGFGLGSKTGIDFPGESAGLLLKRSHWTGTSIGTVPIGQGLAVTAAQMLDVYNTLANGGVRVPLRLVRGTVDGDGKPHAVAPQKGTRVVSEFTSRQVTEMLTEVVRSGTGTAAHIDGYTVAGKTGTAQKPGKGGYLKDAYTASFAGYFPAERPVLSAIVILDEPKTNIYGGTVAAPLFSEVARFAAAHFRIAPSPGSPMLSAHITDTTATREAQAARRAGTWQQALIRRAALSTAALDVSAPIAGAEGATVAGTPTSTVVPATAAPPAVRSAVSVPPSAGGGASVPTVPVPTLAPPSGVADLSVSRNTQPAAPRAIAVEIVVSTTVGARAASAKSTASRPVGETAYRADARASAPTSRRRTTGSVDRSDVAVAVRPSATAPARRRSALAADAPSATSTAIRSSAAAAQFATGAGDDSSTSGVVAARPPTTNVES